MLDLSVTYFFWIFWTVGVLAPLLGQVSTVGLVQSSLNGEKYELRRRGEHGLDLYTATGRIAAVMDRKKPTDKFKGKTSVLASGRPQNTGKIEVVSMTADRI